MRRSPEREMLVLAAREPSPQRDHALAAAVAAVADWRAVPTLAHVHGLAPLLVRALEASAAEARVPAEERRRLTLLARATTLKSAFLFGALERVLERLSARGVAPLVLKGPALAASVYAAPALRPFHDLDLLCRVEELAAAAECLGALGYVAEAHSATTQEGFHSVYFHPADAAAVELHRDLLQLGLPTRCQPALWERAQPLAVGKMRVCMLSLEHQLLHLAVHLHTHGFSRLIWFKDLDLLLRRHQGEVDWVALHALARAEGVSLSLRHALAAVRELLGTPLPPEAGRDLGWDPLGMVAHAVLWPRSRVLALAGKQRLRSVRFNPRQGPSGVVPSLVVMGRRREKLAHLWRASRAPAGEQPAATRRPAPAGEEVDHDAGESLSSFDPRSHQ